MCLIRDPIQCIIPPHILDALANSRDARIRQAALDTLKVSAFIRGRRSVLGSLRAALPTAATQGMQRTIYDSKSQDSDPPSGDRVRGEGDTPSDDPAVNEAYDGLGATYTFYAEVFDRDSIDAHGLPMNAYVHYAQAFNNAFWDGAEMVFGDGDGIVFDRFTKSLDVIGHELTHGVTENTAALVYHKQPGALNESISDVFGSLVKQYHLNQTADKADWLIGAELLAQGIHGKALRSMADPGSAYDDAKLGGKDPQPKHMDDYLQLPDTRPGDFGGVHINSGIPNHAFYLVATQIGGHAWDHAGHIWYTALKQLSEQSQFQDCANITTQVASSLYGTNSAEHKAVKDAWAQVGLPVDQPTPEATRRKPAKGKAADADGVALKKQLERVVQELKKTIDLLG
ncbi:MAG: M4 family metallopeptidase [Gemmataceae bacterium]